VTINVDSLDPSEEIAAEVERLTATYEFVKLSKKGQNGYLFIARNSVIDRRSGNQILLIPVYSLNDLRKHQRIPKGILEHSQNEYTR